MRNSPFQCQANIDMFLIQPSNPLVLVRSPQMGTGRIDSITHIEGMDTGDQVCFSKCFGLLPGKLAQGGKHGKTKRFLWLFNTLNEMMFAEGQCYLKGID